MLFENFDYHEMMIKIINNNRKCTKKTLLLGVNQPFFWFTTKVVFLVTFKTNNSYTYVIIRTHHFPGRLSPVNTVCPGSSDPPEKIFNIFASENDTVF